MRKHFLATLLVLVGWAVTAPASWVGAAHAQFTITIPATGQYTTTGGLATQNSPLNPLTPGYYCDTYTVMLNQGTDYLFNMAGTNAVGQPLPTGTGYIFLRDASNNLVNLTSGGDPYLPVYGPNTGNWTGNVDGTPGWGGVINPTGGACLVYTAQTTGLHTLVCTTPNPNSQFSYPLLAMQMNVINTPEYVASSFPYTNSNVWLNRFDGYGNGIDVQASGGEYGFVDAYTLQLTPGLYTFSGTLAGVGAPPDLFLVLVNPSGQVVFDDGPMDPTGQNGPMNLQYQVQNPGTYYMLVYSYNAVWNSSNVLYEPYIYSLSVTPPPPGTTGLSVSAPAPTAGNTATVTVTVFAQNTSDGPPSGNVMASIDGGAGQTQPLTMATAYSSTATFMFTITTSGTTHPVTANYVPMGTTAGGANWLASSGSGAVGTIVAVTVPASVAGNLSPNAYSGGAAPTSGDIGNFSGHPQDWYNVTLTAGQPYVISIWAGFDSYMSLQYNGVEVAFNDDSWQGWLGTPVASQIAYTPPAGATGVYTVIVSDWGGGSGSYTLTIPNPTPTVTSVNPLSLPYSTSGTFSTSSYYGTAANGIGSPPIASEGQGQSVPPWADYFQNWYSFPLTAGSTYTFTMTMTMTTGANAVLSLQSGNNQVAYGYTQSAQATIIFTPQTTGTYSLICSQDITGPGNSYSLAITGAGSVGTKTTILQGLDLPPANLNITVIVTALGGTPTGNVTLSLDGGAGITQALSGGQTVFSIPNPVPGYQTVTAVYAGGLPTYLPSTASISLTQGIPNTKLVPPGRDNAELRAIYAIGAHLEPVAYSVETAAVRCWVAGLDCRKG